MVSQPPGPLPSYVLHHLPQAAQLRLMLPVYEACFGEPAPEDFIERVYERPSPVLQLASMLGEVVGYKLGYRRNPEVFYSWLGGVLPAHRRQGIARELLQRQHAWAQWQGYARVRTDGTNDFKSMLLLNLQEGFDIIGTYNDAERGPCVMLECSVSSPAQRSKQ